MLFKWKHGLLLWLLANLLYLIDFVLIILKLSTDVAQTFLLIETFLCVVL